MTSITRQFINCCWYFFKWGVAIALFAGLGLAAHWYHQVDEQIRQRVEAKIAAAYPNLTVRVRQAQLVEGEGIEIRGLSITEPSADGPQAEMVYLDELFIACQPNLEDLVRGRLDVTEVTISRPVLRATRRHDGTWSVGKLLPLPKFSDKPPGGTVENATIEIFDPLKNPSSTLIVRDVHMKWDPIAAQPAEPHEAGSAANAGRPVTIEGYCVADHIQRIDVRGTIDPDQRSCTLAGHVEGLDISPELRAMLPAELADRAAALGTLRAQADLDFHITSQPDAAEPLAFNIQGALTRGRIDDPRLPYPLSDLRASVAFTQAGFEIRDLTAQHGPASLKLSCRREGYADNSPLHLEAIGNCVTLDRQLAGFLPEVLRKQWHDYQPEGEVDADLKLSFDGTAWKPELIVKCLDVAFTYHKVPYRFERGSGTLVLKDNVLESENFVAYAGGQPVRFDGRVVNPGPNWTGFVTSQGNNIPFDEKLFSAIPEKARRIVRSMNPRGTFNYQGDHRRDDPRQAVPHQHLAVHLNRCTVSYDRFPYPLGNVRGRIELTNGHWDFRDLEGTNDTGLVTCQGTLTPTADGDRLALEFTGRNIALEEELRDALQPSSRQAWTMLKPRGAVDLAVHIGYLATEKKLTVDVDAQPCGETSIEPACFPYRMERLQGAIHYRDGHVEFENLRAVHGRTLLASGGSCDLEPDGSWRLALKNLSIDRLRADTDLLAALPDALKRAVTELRPNGPVNLRGTMEFSKAADAAARVRSKWDVTLNLHQLRIDCGTKLDDMFGSIRLTGGGDGARFSSRGELALESVIYKNFQLTDVRGPLWFDNGYVFMGVKAEGPDKGRNRRHISARLFGGTLLGDCEVALGSPAQYTIRGTLAEADIAQFANEHLSGRQKLNGKVLANVEFRGTTRGTHTLRGAGNVRLRDADIYELPVMVALLKILSIKPPDATAFTKSDIDFRIQGEHIVLDRINFNGDAVSLIGQGQMNLDSQIDLTFHTMVGRDDFRIPVLSNVMGEASQQIMQIHVGGSVDHPVTRSEVLPGVNQALQQLQSDLQMPIENPPPRQATGKRLKDLMPWR